MSKWCLNYDSGEYVYHWSWLELLLRKEEALRAG